MIRSAAGLLRTTLLLGGLAPTTVLAGCDAGSGSVAGGTLTSQSVSETTASPIGAGQEWRISETPSVLLGNDSIAEQTFHNIASLHRDSSGRLLVADRSTGEIRVFNARGRMLVRFGGRGGGAEEFAALTAMGPYRGDSIHAVDALAQRVGIWTAGGEFGRSLQLDVPGFAHGAAATADGEFAVVAKGLVPTVNSAGERVTDSISVHLFTADGRHVSNLGGFALTELYGASHGQRLISTTIPFGPRGYYHVGARAFYYAWSDRWEVVRVQYGAANPDTFRIALPREALEPPVVERWISDKLSSVDRAQRGGYRRYWAEFPWPDRLPTMDRLVEDAEGNLWIRDFLVPGDTISQWLVLGPDGSMRAHLAVPARFEPKQIGADFIAGVLQDPYDRELVAIYPLERGY